MISIELRPTAIGFEALLTKPGQSFWDHLLNRSTSVRLAQGATALITVDKALSELKRLELKLLGHPARIKELDEIVYQ